MKYKTKYKSGKRKSMLLTYVILLSLLAIAWLCQLAVYKQPISLVSPIYAKVDSKNIYPEKDPELSPTAREAIEWAFKDKGQRVINEAIQIARCESGLKESSVGNNTNKTQDVGVFQINDVHKVNSRFLKDIRVNVMVARKLYEEQGWRPWVCARKLGIVK